MKNLPPLVGTAALLFSGALAYAQSEVVSGGALLAAGLILLGVWITMEIRNRDEDDEDKKGH